MMVVQSMVFGYDKPDGGSVRRMKSGYEAKISSSRPPLNKYPLGFFVEDYNFTGLGDLNESNGRFCVTPEYPNGTFVYFATFQETPESVGPFKKTLENHSSLNWKYIPTQTE